MKPTGATKEATATTLSRPLPWSSRQYSNVIAVNDASDFPVGQFYDVDAAAYAITAVNERERLREALRAALNSLSRTVCKSYPNYPEEQMQISPTMTVADARAVLNDATPSTSVGGG